MTERGALGDLPWVGAGLIGEIADLGPTHRQIDESRVADGLPPIYADEPGGSFSTALLKDWKQTFSFDSAGSGAIGNLLGTNVIEFEVTAAPMWPVPLPWWKVLWLKLRRKPRPMQGPPGSQAIYIAFDGSRQDIYMPAAVIKQVHRVR